VAGEFVPQGMRKIFVEQHFHATRGWFDFDSIHSPASASTSVTWSRRTVGNGSRK
jgi:hypothetical protein